ncbi:MAG: DoxX family protein [Acidobacteria bacterium]|nr:DoxX family protein [Acidobacteriota bacterium]
MFEKLLSTKDVKPLGIVRISLGVVFLSTGAMKFLVPMLWNAWSGQLTQAKIPFYSFNLWFVPIIEIIIGLLLIAGLGSRFAALAVIAMMVVATYVHAVVEDPSLFPLQPSAPVIPILVLLLSGYVLWHGGGAWSLDRKLSPGTKNP